MFYKFKENSIKEIKDLTNKLFNELKEETNIELRQY